MFLYWNAAIARTFTLFSSEDDHVAWPTHSHTELFLLAGLACSMVTPKLWTISASPSYKWRQNFTHYWIDTSDSYFSLRISKCASANYIFHQMRDFTEWTTWPTYELHWFIDIMIVWFYIYIYIYTHFFIIFVNTEPRNNQIIDNKRKRGESQMCVAVIVAPASK